MRTSSGDLHPRSGARIVLERETDETYRVAVHLAGGITVASALRFGAGGPPVLEPAIEPAWAHEEVLKLARVLRQDRRPKLSRWRPGP